MPERSYPMEKKENTRKKTPEKKKPIKIIVVPVYVGGKSMGDAFFDVIYNHLLSKSA
jgi:hypothetical protein